MFDFSGEKHSVCVSFAILLRLSEGAPRFGEHVFHVEGGGGRGWWWFGLAPPAASRGVCAHPLHFGDLAIKRDCICVGFPACFVNCLFAEILQVLAFWCVKEQVTGRAHIKLCRQSFVD